MKVAIELAGIVGGIGGKHGKGDSKEALQLGYNHYKKFILDHNDCDIFCHTASLERVEDIIELYKPKKIKALKQPKFTVPKDAIVGTDTRRIQAHYHKWYGHKIASSLRQEYEKETGTKYDIVYISRYDLAWNKIVDFSKFDPEKVWTGNWNVLYNNNKKISNHAWYRDYNLRCKKMIENNDTSNFKNIKSVLYGYPHTDDGLLETWLFSKPEYMNKFCTLFDHIDEYSTKKPNTWWGGKSTIHDKCGQITNHRLVPVHLEQLGLLDKLSFAFYLHDEFALARRQYYGVK